MATYGFWAIEIDDLADSLSQALGIRLYRQFSPMIGTWYTDTDLSTLIKQHKDIEEVTAADYAHTFELVLNDSEPGYRPPEFPCESECILRVEADRDACAEIEEKLRQAGLRFSLLWE
jgi:hypothetical protein